MNKDYKIMAALIPIIIILCFALYGDTGILGFANSNSNLNAHFSEFSKFMEPFTSLALQGKSVNKTITKPDSPTITTTNNNQGSSSSSTDYSDQTPTDTSTNTDQTPTDTTSQNDQTPTDSNPTME